MSLLVELCSNDLESVEHGQDERCGLHDHKAQDDDIGINLAKVDPPAIKSIDIHCHEGGRGVDQDVVSAERARHSGLGAAAVSLSSRGLVGTILC